MVFHSTWYAYYKTQEKKLLSYWFKKSDNSIHGSRSRQDMRGKNPRNKKNPLTLYILTPIKWLTSKLYVHRLRSLWTRFGKTTSGRLKGLHWHINNFKLQGRQDQSVTLTILNKLANIPGFLLKQHQDHTLPVKTASKD